MNERDDKEWKDDKLILFMAGIIAIIYFICIIILIG